MNRQLTIFDKDLGDSDRLNVSPTNTVGDTENQAIERYLARAKIEPSVCVKKYHPNGRKTQYFRLDYRDPTFGKPKSIHIRGGNVSSKLANYRAGVLQKMIDRGADLAEIIAQAKDFNQDL